MVRIVTAALILFSFLTGVLSANAQNPFISKDSPQNISPVPGPPSLFLAKIGAWQQQLNQRMAILTRQVRETGSLRPLLSLILIAFLYGVIHAAGPGHGKAVATSYLISRGRKLGGGILLGNLIALFHGASGVVLVVAVYFVLQRGVTGPLENTTRTTQLISYSLFALVGVGMLVRGLLSWRRPADSDGSNSAGEPGERKRNPLMMALAVGMIPCPGVALVMLFCLSLNAVALGLVLALFLVLGMGVTISAVGVAAVAGKRLALGVIERRPRLTENVERGAEITGAVLVTALGLLLLAAMV